MSDFAKQWGDEYNKCSIPLQGKGSKRMPEQLAVVSGSAPLLKGLIGVDKNDPTQVRGDKEKAATHKALVKEAKGYSSAASKYKKLIDVAIKATSKDEKDAYRALKKLAAHLDFISAKVEHHVVGLSKENAKALAKAGDRVEKETKAARDKGLSDKEVNAEVDYAKQLKSLSQFPTAMGQAYNKAKSAVQSIKSDPTPATYNTEMFSGGRNYTQQVSNLIKLSKDSKCPPKVKALLKGVEKYKNGLDAYGNGERRSIAADATEKEVLTYLKTFAKLVKETYPYEDEMIKFLKKNKIK